MASSLDVAAYILEKHGSMTATKLQKLVYYSQAWHLVWDEKPLFLDRIEAWANGPVTRKLYSAHYRQYMVDTIPGGDSGRLTDSERDTIDVVLQFYGDRSAAELSELTHREAPWREARGDTPPGASGDAEITHASMAEYYESLLGTSADD